MKFIEVVVDVIGLSRRVNEEDRALHEQFGLGDGISLGDPKTWDYMQAPRPAVEALEAYLEGLSDSEVARIQTLMYAGRDNDADFKGLHKHLRCDKEDAIQTISEKAPLGDYLADGLALAQKNFVDLDADW